MSEFKLVYIIKPGEWSTCCIEPICKIYYYVVFEIVIERWECAYSYLISFITQYGFIASNEYYSVCRIQMIFVFTSDSGMTQKVSRDPSYREISLNHPCHRCLSWRNRIVQEKKKSNKTIQCAMLVFVNDMIIK